jgi:hypothetical protein
LSEFIVRPTYKVKHLYKVIQHSFEREREKVFLAARRQAKAAVKTKVKAYKHSHKPQEDPQIETDESVTSRYQELGNPLYGKRKISWKSIWKRHRLGVVTVHQQQPHQQHRASTLASSVGKEQPTLFASVLESHHQPLEARQNNPSSSRNGPTALVRGGVVKKLDDDNLTLKDAGVGPKSRLRFVKILRPRKEKKPFGQGQWPKLKGLVGGGAAKRRRGVK